MCRTGRSVFAGVRASRPRRRVPDVPGVTQIITPFRAGFPDRRIEIEEQVATGDPVASRITLRGAHGGALFGTPATGNRVTVSRLTEVRVKNGKVHDSWVKNDTNSLMQQIGATAQPAGAR